MIFASGEDHLEMREPTGHLTLCQLNQITSSATIKNLHEDSAFAYNLVLPFKVASRFPLSLAAKSNNNAILNNEDANRILIPSGDCSDVAVWGAERLCFRTRRVLTRGVLIDNC